MIVSHRHKFVFVEVPHTGSHSISEQLVKHYGGQPILRKHANVTQFLGQASREERGYFKFATVRNPLDAATTDYSKLAGNHKGQYTNPAMLQRNGGHVTEQHLAEFRFVHDEGADFPAFFRRFRSKLYNNWFLIGDQHFDHVIRFEDLQAGFSAVLEKLGIPQQEPIGHTNPTRAKKRPWAEFFTPDIYDLAVRCYGPFMHKWRYEFPESWGNIRIPAVSSAEFQVLDRLSRLAAARFTLDPDHPALHRLKTWVDRATGATV